MVWIILAILLGTPLWFVLAWRALDVVERLARGYRVDAEARTEREESDDEWERALSDSDRRSDNGW